MTIDICILASFIIALILGLIRGFIAQLCMLVGLYIAILLAPTFAGSVGHIFTEEPGLAYLVGFATIILFVWVLVWIIGPLLRKMLIFKALKKTDSLMGMGLAVLTTFIIVSVACSLFATINIGNLRPDKILELGANGLTEEEIEAYAEKFEQKDSDVRDYFEPKYVEYEVLDESLLFGGFAAVGDVLCPGLSNIEEEIMEWAISMK